MPRPRPLTSGFFPLGRVRREGFVPLKVASRAGLLHLRRQVCYDREAGRHCFPSKALLPPHEGMVITRALQEWACLLSLDLPFDAAQRLLGWLTGEARILASSELRRLVCQHGQVLRQAEQAEVALLAGEAGQTAQPRWTPARPPRRPPAWAAAVQPAVEAALAEAAPTPPPQVRVCDWERLLAVRREEARPADVAALARLGPEMEPDQVVATADEVLVRTPDTGKWAELRTARVATPAGYRYLCGVGDEFLQALLALLLVAAGPQGRVLLLGDGVGWLTTFFAQLQARLARSTLRLDWYHLGKKCRDRISRMGGDRRARRQLLAQLVRALWEGQVGTALELLAACRPHAKEEKPLRELMGYLERHREAIPNYRAERQCRSIGSAWVEKANDLLVARRQKRRGMHWQVPTSEGLARLKGLVLNHDWDAYWHRRELPRLATL
jgi:hypothetical protein